MPSTFECEQCSALATPNVAAGEETPLCPDCGGTLTPLAVFSPDEERSPSDVAEDSNDSAKPLKTDVSADSNADDRPKSRRNGYIGALAATLIAFGAMFACLYYFGVLKPSARSQHIAAREETLQLFNEIASTLDTLGRIRPGDGSFDAMHDAFDRIDICCDRLAEIHKARGDLPDVPEEFRMDLIKQYKPKLKQTSKRLDGARQSFDHSPYARKRRATISRMSWLRESMHYNWRETN